MFLITFTSLSRHAVRVALVIACLSAVLSVLICVSLPRLLRMHGNIFLL